MRLYFITINIAVVMVIGTSSAGVCSVASGNYTTINLTPSSLHYINPARGFYREEVTSSTPELFLPLTKSMLGCWREQDGTAVILRGYLLDSFRDGSPLTTQFLSLVRADMLAAYESGWSVILRFMYNTFQDKVYKGGAEPDLPAILAHIDQLAGLLTAFNGVIIMVQAGFLGEYGTWYKPGTIDFRYEREQILKKLLQVTHESMIIQVPKTIYKTEFLQDPNPSTLLNIFHNKVKAKIGHYHECLIQEDTNHLAGAFGNLQTSKDVLNYLRGDTAIAPMTGRLCHVTNASRYLCADSTAIFNDVHLTFLDALQPQIALNFYHNHGCWGSFMDTLGYSFHVTKVKLPTFTVEGTLCISIGLTNKGLAPVSRDFVPYLVFNKQHNNKWYKETQNPNDITLARTWMPGLDIQWDHVVNTAILGHGRFDVYIAMSELTNQYYTDSFILLHGEINSQPIAKPHLGLNFIGSVEINNHQNQSLASSGLNKHDLETFVKPTFRNVSVVWHNGLSHDCIVLPDHPPATTLHKYATCNKRQVYISLLEGKSIISPSSHMCSNSNSESKPEAVPVQLCNAINPSEWVPVSKVLDNCEEIQQFTPVAIFEMFPTAHYERTDNGVAGVLIQCIKTGNTVTGVKLVRQQCGSKLQVETLSVSGSYELQNMYIIGS